MEVLDNVLAGLSSFIWSWPILVLLLGGGLFFLVYSRFIPFKYFGHAINVLRGKYDDPNDPGEISHFQALASALAATVGMGNISGVALAIAGGGPGALFWMWVSAFVGIATKFFTCTLAVLYRGKDSTGQIQGGPMYVIVEGLGKQWKPLAAIFCVAGMFGCLPIFQANQLTQVIKEVVLIPNQWATAESLNANIIMAGLMVALVSLVIFGGIKRIGTVAAKMVPFMVVLYFVSVLLILLLNYDKLLPTLGLIISDAFSAKAVLGGAVGAIIIQGAKRAAFSNEAGVGTAPMAHGAAKTTEPVREGLVAMMGPAIDTLVICTLTAMAILITGVWEGRSDASGTLEGITMTALAFGKGLPYVGQTILVICVLSFSITSLFSYSYYGGKCMAFLAGVHNKVYYNVFYIATIVFGALASVQAVVSIIEVAFAIMAFPTMISTLILAPKVMKAAKAYLSKKQQPA